MKNSVVALFLLSTSLNVFASSMPYHKQTYNHNGKEINYYVVQQGKQKSVNLLVLMQGSDCQSIVNNPNIVKRFGAVIPNSDILLVEKTGLNEEIGIDGQEVPDEKCPVEYMKNDSPFERADNYIALLNKLKGDYQRIIIVGGSEGATVANLVASKVNFITASVVLNSGGRYFLDDVLYSIQHTTPTQDVANSIEGFKQFAEAAKRKQLDENQFVSGHGPKWWYESLSIDSLNVIQSIKHPHLIIQTMNDVNVDAYSTEKMIKDNQNPQISFKMYQNLDHFFKDNTGQLHTDIIVDDIQQWYRTEIKEQ